MEHNICSTIPQVPRQLPRAGSLCEQVCNIVMVSMESTAQKDLRLVHKVMKDEGFVAG